jgi:hypothetical protein
MLQVVYDDLKQAREILQLLMARERLKRERIELASDIIVAQVCLCLFVSPIAFWLNCVSPQTLESVDLVNALRICHDQVAFI